MLYETYEDYKKKYEEIQKRYDEVLSEKERLFGMTQPKAVKYDKERVSGGVKTNSFDDYLIQKDNKHIDEQLAEIRIILHDRSILLKAKEEELRGSKNWYDIIYVYYFIDGLSTHKIAKRVPYSQQRVWQIVKDIKKILVKTSQK